MHLYECIEILLIKNSKRKFENRILKLVTASRDTITDPVKSLKTPPVTSTPVTVRKPPVKISPPLCRSLTVT